MLAERFLDWFKLDWSLWRPGNCQSHPQAVLQRWWHWWCTPGRWTARQRLTGYGSRHRYRYNTTGFSVWCPATIHLQTYNLHTVKLTEPGCSLTIWHRRLIPPSEFQLLSKLMWSWKLLIFSSRRPAGWAIHLTQLVQVQDWLPAGSTEREQGVRVEQSVDTSKWTYKEL